MTEEQESVTPFGNLEITEGALTGDELRGAAAYVEAAAKAAGRARASEATRALLTDLAASLFDAAAQAYQREGRKPNPRQLQ